MKRTAAFLGLALVGLALFLIGLTAPVYFRAIDARLVSKAEPSVTLITEGLNQLRLGRAGAARVFARAAVLLKIPNTARLQEAIREFAVKNPDVSLLGGEDPYLKRALPHPLPTTGSREGRPIIGLLLPRETRAAAREVLLQSRRPGVIEVLKTRELTNTVQFPAATSSAGQALEAAILVAAFLVEEDQASSPLLHGLVNDAARAMRTGEVGPVEDAYLALLSLGRRFDWGALNALLRESVDTATLRGLAGAFRDHDSDLPVIYSAMLISGQPARVLDFLQRYPQTAGGDITYALRSGKAGLQSLLALNLRIFYPETQHRPEIFAASLRIWSSLYGFNPGLALAVKYALVLAGGFFWALAGFYCFGRAASMEAASYHPVAPWGLLAVMVALSVLILGEPFIIETPLRETVPFEIHFPMAAQAIRATLAQPFKTSMTIDPISLFSLLLFLAIQAVIYFFCRRRLFEIMNQPVASRIKLRLLENEEHLFDAGLYFGFVGTVISLILVSIGIIRPSLMAAYSSTSFGIIFVSVLKIFHLRPLRRKLILESEAQPS